MDATSEDPKSFDPFSGRLGHTFHDTQIWIQTRTLEETRHLLQISEKPAVVVVQGAESPGHRRANDGMSLMTLPLEIADTICNSPSIAGGIAYGHGVAAVLYLGTSGVSTKECSVGDIKLAVSASVPLSERSMSRSIGIADFTCERLLLGSG
ncbi:hypothetical protein MMC15_006980 [Xylographa vitiligo]|nr:hypothetical protein [Xylographa vitiligo]